METARKERYMIRPTALYRKSGEPARSVGIYTIKLLTMSLIRIGMLCVKIQLVLAHVDSDNEEIFDLNFAAHVGYVEHVEHPFLIRKFALDCRESEASFSVF
jgi:hypothetical protein